MSALFGCGPLPSARTADALAAIRIGKYRKRGSCLTKMPQTSHELPFYQRLFAHNWETLSGQKQMALPPDTSLEDVLLRIRQTEKNPNVGKTTQVVLKEGPRAYKVATLFEILGSDAKSVHHHALRIEHFQRRKEGWLSDAGRIVTLEDTESKEIEKLFKMLSTAYGGELKGKTGDYHIVSDEFYTNIEPLVSAISGLETTGKLSVLGEALKHLSEQDISVNDLAAVLQMSSPAMVNQVAIASRLVEYTAAYEKLRVLVEAPGTPESAFQKHLAENPWMFGSEYSELLARRHWTRDEQLDYMLRRTVDGYLEIIEIKTAFEDPLFHWDSSHECYYPSAKLSGVLGQVMGYLEEVERDRDKILVKDDEDTLKIRARAIVGRDGDDGHQRALRNFNAHLYRIEILTYDQLLRIAERVLSIFNDAAPSDDLARSNFLDDDIPF